MRLIQITIPTGKRETILGVLDDEDIDYVVSDETSGRDYIAVVSFPLPSPAVEPVLDKLKNAGLPDQAYTIILDAETVISSRFDELERRYADASDVKERVSREELREKVRDFVPTLKMYSIMVIASVSIATAGVLLDSAAVVVGSMVIAPLIGPAMATSLGTVLEDRDLFITGTKFQIIGFILALVTAALFALFVRTVHLVPPGIEVLLIDQVQERLAPDFLSLVVALGAGVAGAYSLSSDISTALVGVMIAVALIPPVAVAGIGIAWALPYVVTGSLILVIVNFASINLAALTVLWYQGYRPRLRILEKEARRDTIKRIGVLVVVIAVLSVFLGGVTYSSYQTATTESDIRDEVNLLLESQYPELSVIEVRIEHEARSVWGYPLPFVRQPDEVIVTVGREPQTQYSDVAEILAGHLEQTYDVTVVVRFIDTQRV